MSKSDIVTSMKRAIITGPTGPLGISLIKELLSEGVEVVAVCQSGSRRRKNLPEDSNLTVVSCNIDESDRLVGVLSQKDINEADVFYHFAWTNTVDGRNDIEAQLNNVKYAIGWVKAAVDMGCNTFIGAGSQAEYGLCETKLDEKTFTNPTTAYGMAKLAAGQMTRLMAKQLGIRHIWTRILSVYGPNDRKDSLIGSLMMALKNGEEFDTTEGRQVWDFLYEDDAAKAFYLLGEAGVDGKTYVLGSGNSKPLKEYILEAQKLINKDAVVNFGAIPYGENCVMHLEADISELKKDTGFEPRVTFEEGIFRILCKLD